MAIFIGDILVARGLAAIDDVNQAISMQSGRGRGVGQLLMEMGKLAPRDLDDILSAAPHRPNSIAETGLSLPDLLNLMVKVLQSIGEGTPSTIGQMMKLAPHPVHELLEAADERRLLTVLGAQRTDSGSELRYVLTEKGKQWALEALAQSAYIGPAPVPLASYSERIIRQRITGERVDEAAIHESFSGIVVSDSFVEEIGPAINSGRSILLYGSAGNGKSTIGERIGNIFRDVIYIPYCFEVEGKVVRVFDPGTHTAIKHNFGDRETTPFLSREDLDDRWVACRRPLIITGGELTLEMLDLSYSPDSRFYEAPLHIKALGGVFMIDDFGRQLVSPTALLNRWIVPMESRLEYLKLHTGKSFSLPFDELVIFSTNLSPGALMDPAFLRRIPYKIELSGPTHEEFRAIFEAMAASADIALPEGVVDYVIAQLREHNNFPLANFQPKFIIDQVRASCKFAGIDLQFQPRFIDRALKNLYTKDTPGYGENSKSRIKIRTVDAA